MVDEGGPEVPLTNRSPLLLRFHQQQAVEAAENSIRGNARNVIVSMPTGSGKTLTAVALVARLMADGHATRVLYLVDRTVQAHQIEDVIRGLPSTGGYQIIDRYPLYGQGDGLRRLLDQHPSLPGHYVCIATWAQLRTAVKPPAGRNSFLDALGTLPENLFDLAVIEIAGPEPKEFGSVTELIRTHFQAPTVLFVPDEALLGNQQGVIAFKYTYEQALRDGATHGRRPGSPPPFPETAAATDLGRRVFVYAAGADHAGATAVHAALSTAGIRSTLVPPSEDDAIDALLQEIRAGDSLVYLLSPDSVGNPWLDVGLDKILTRRGAELVPALLRECLVPMTLTGQAVVDVRRDAAELIDKLKWAGSIDLTALDAGTFEQLVIDLLGRMGFTAEPSPAGLDSGFDLQAVYRDRPGFGEPTPYLVQIKAAPGARPTIRALRQLVDRLPALAPRHALVVTSGQLTSVAASTLAGSNQARHRLHILDGPRLEELLLEQPDLIEKYFLRHGEPHGHV